MKARFFELSLALTFALIPVSGYLTAADSADSLQRSEINKSADHRDDVAWWGWRQPVKYNYWRYNRAPGYYQYYNYPYGYYYYNRSWR